VSANHTPAFMQLNVPAAIQAAVDQAEWREFVAEHREKSARRGDSVCPKCGVGRMQFYQPKSRYECPECSYVEPAPTTGFGKQV